MSIVVRYVADNTPVDRLLSLTVLEDKSGEEHATEISISMEKLYFQSYDFMSGTAVIILVLLKENQAV
jgi:hypothetical protein